MNALLRCQPDAQLALADESASCSLWWHRTPLHAGRRVGAIGQFNAASAESGAELLAVACVHLAAQGCGVAVGPMDGNTWRSYRAVIEQGDEAPFFLEPHTPPQVADGFARAGFAVAATYASSVQGDLRSHDPRIARVARRAAVAGIVIRALDRRQAERDLLSIHALSHAAFNDAFMFSPIPQDEFLAQYGELLPHVETELVLLAEQRGELVAFALGLPDVLAPDRGTVILKTVATRPGLAYRGLGHLLVDRGAQIAAQLGYRRAVHALMHEENRSFGWSGRYGRVFRRYALFARTL